MRICVPTTREEPEASGVLDTLGVEHEIIHLAHDEAYWEFFVEAWARPEDGDLLIVEHDISATIEALDSIRECPELYCACPYPYFVGPRYAGLGFTRWRAEAMRQDPDLWQRVGQHSNADHPPRTWCTLDAWVQQETRTQIHVHRESVGHSNTSAPSHGCQ